MHILCVNALKLLSAFFLLLLGQDLAFLVKTGWQPCEVHGINTHTLQNAGW